MQIGFPKKKCKSFLFLKAPRLKKNIPLTRGRRLNQDFVQSIAGIQQPPPIFLSIALLPSNKMLFLIPNLPFVPNQVWLNIHIRPDYL